MKKLLPYDDIDTIDRFDVETDEICLFPRSKLVLNKNGFNFDIMFGNFNTTKFRPANQPGFTFGKMEEPLSHRCLFVWIFCPGQESFRTLWIDVFFYNDPFPKRHSEVELNVIAKGNLTCPYFRWEHFMDFFHRF